MPAWHRKPAIFQTKYVQSAMAGKVPQPKNKLFQTVQEFLADHFMTAKVAFFLSVAKEVTPF